MEFTSTHAACGDALQSNMDCDSETDSLEQLFRPYGSGSAREVFHFGCGMGTHAPSFARCGQSDTTPTGT